MVAQTHLLTVVYFVPFQVILACIQTYPELWKLDHVKGLKLSD